ncbi:thiosulfate oxidation carrier complex protein SoxZ [Sulfurimonas sp. CVO]|jgi:sulfur-oxidizing protein SoxZ|uniref:thiosulfate oxidation carrier complex protein SoxZ n=1 Tax=Sulfurimonas sp. CVO TaxID=2283483 RepID=UPI00132EE67A|nr:thiosulfate oxidation carrier complex protein SoxZ [Sulfurimonas sp. CVO]QHG92086.1 thiosulfate oxidation carrier complex protein SoxZ [Sulfurimonas sp. CVO]
MKLKAKENKGIVEVKLLLDSPMVGKEEAEIKKIGVDFLTHVTAKVNGNVVWEASTGPFLSKNPYFKFVYKGAKGDEVVIETVDNKGETKSDTVKVK